MAFIHTQSCECTKSELDIFQIPATQTSVESGSVTEYNPVSAIAHGLPIEFYIQGSGQEYIDLANTQLYVRTKITLGNGDAITPAHHVGPINLTLHSLFSEVDFKLNDTLISSTNNTYAYRAYLETLLSYGTDAKASQLTSALYYKDTAGQMEVADPTPVNTANQGLRKRYSFFSNGGIVDMIDKLHVDMCFQERFLPSDVGMRIRLVRQKDAFVLMSDVAQPGFKIQIMECKLLVRKVKLSPSVFVAHAKALEVGNAKYPIHRVVCKTFTVPAGNLDFSQESVFTGQLPSRLVIGLVDNDSFNGAWQKNPFNFKTMGLTHLKLYIDGQQQYIKPIETDFANGKYIDAYLSLFEGTGKLNKDEGIDINRLEYANGYTLYAFDLTPDLCEGDHLNLIRDGTLRLDAKFGVALPNTINVIVYGEFQNLIEVDRNRNIIFDFNN
jgi:hypothetical protein